MSTWTTAALGTASLFPAFGQLKQLKGFYPPGRRSWFTTIATAASLVVYAFVQFSFDSLPVYWPVLHATLVATVCLLLYVSMHVATSGRRTSIAGWRKGLLLFVLLGFYTAAIAAFTYAYNVLYQLQYYRVFRGHVVATDTRRPLVGATLLFNPGQNSSTVVSGEGGRFVKVVQRATFSGVQCKYQGTGGATCYSRTLVPGELPTTDDWFPLEIDPCAR
jgi:hypothetical protein